jgi:hypothetical protein
VDRKRHAGELYSRDSVSVIGIPYDIYERGLGDLKTDREVRVGIPLASVRLCWTLLSAADSRGLKLLACTG